MTKNYTDFVDAMYEAQSNGLSVDKLILTQDSLDTFMTSGDFTVATEETHDRLGEFSVNIEQGDGNYVLAENGERVSL